MHLPIAGWRFDPGVFAGVAIAVAAYVGGLVRLRRLHRRWPPARGACFALGLASAVVAIESPLDAAGDVRFAPHMVQHLILADVTAPFVLLGAPLLLVLAAAPTTIARRIVSLLKHRIGRILAFPGVTWSAFVLALWLVHFTGFFEAALERESVHTLEHLVIVGTALLFWLPVIAIGPVPWTDGPLAYPTRMFYLLLAMPAQGMLGFALHGARHVLYARYAAAGLEDQRAAGEIMWVGGTLAMFVAFMFVGLAWARDERRLGERADRLDASEVLRRSVRQSSS